jgi:hypothetical protein
MNQDVLRIRKVAIVSLVLLVLVEAACFFIFERSQFFAILASGLLSLLFFVITLFVYFKASKAQAQKKLKLLLFIFFGKLVISAGVFFLIYRAGTVNIVAFLVSFLVFFTVFFNLEVFLIYKRFLFYNDN